MTSCMLFPCNTLQYSLKLLHPHRTLPHPSHIMALRNLSNGSSYVQVAGSEGKKTIIFIHGLGGSSTNWDTVLRHSGLSDTYKTITFDLKGHGLSPMESKDQLAFDDYVRSVKEVLDSEKVEKAHIVGHSMGGLIATHFAAKWPQMVEKLSESIPSCRYSKLKSFIR